MNPALDLYIAKSAEFAKVILEEIRFQVHGLGLEIEECIKWQMPHFIYKKKTLCAMGSFKTHCSVVFWLAEFMDSAHFKKEGMGHLGKIKSMDDLPKRDVFRQLLLQAAQLIDEGKTISRKKTETKSIKEADILLNELAKNLITKQNFLRLSRSQQAEYHEWLLEAKTEITQEKRLKTGLIWIAEGKPLNWKYMKSRKWTENS